MTEVIDATDVRELHTTRLLVREGTPVIIRP